MVVLFHQKTVEKQGKALIFNGFFFIYTRLNLQFFVKKTGFWLFPVTSFDLFP